jgi:uncharacterized protein
MIYSCPMIPLGTPVPARVKSIASGRCTVEIEDREFPMNIWELPPKSKPGKELEVIVYNDSRDSLKASCLKPLARLGEFAALKVKTVNEWGAFLEWGLPKDLFLPLREQKETPKPGAKVVIRVALDHDKKGLIASEKLTSFFDYSPAGLSPGDQVQLLVFEELKIGFGVVVEGRYRGILYKNELFEELSRGEKRQGLVKKIRDDGRIDCTLQPVGFKASAEKAKNALLEALRTSGGFLPLHDKSSPEEIADALHMSKKNFKRAAGVLYKEQKVLIEKQGIRLRS